MLGNARKQTTLVDTSGALISKQTRSRLKQLSRRGCINLEGINIIRHSTEVPLFHQTLRLVSALLITFQNNFQVQIMLYGYIINSDM